MQVGCCCPHLPVVVFFVLCAQGLCNMSLQPGRYSLVSLTDLTHLNRYTDVYCMPCISCRSCRSDAAVLCHLPVVVFIAVCTGFVQHVTAARQVQPGLFDRLAHPNRCTDVYWYALNLVQVMQVPCSCLLLSAGCCAVAACRVLQHVNTGGYRLQGLLHRYIKTIVLNSSVLLSSYCADAAVYGLFCWYCCMHRVCASRKSDRY
jgi:hypothetical protein